MYVDVEYLLFSVPNDIFFLYLFYCVVDIDEKRSIADKVHL